MFRILGGKTCRKVYIYACYVSKPPHLPNVEILILYVLSNDDCKFAINLFHIIWGTFENMNLLYFLLKMQIWNGINLLNIGGNPIKAINVNLSILSVWWKVVEWTPQIGNIINFISEFRIKNCWMYPWNKLTSGVTLQCILDMTIVTSHFCFQLWWVCTAINFGSNLGYFLAVE